jgi:hypothetical protein
MSIILDGNDVDLKVLDLAYLMFGSKELSV